MGVSTVIYFENRVTPFEIVAAIESEFGVVADISAIRFEKAQYVDDFDRHCGYIRFKYDGIDYSWHFYPYNYISGGNRDKTNPDTLSGGGLFVENIKAMPRIIKYFGGWFVENDCSGENNEVFFPKTVSEIELTNSQKLTNLVCTNIDFKYSKAVIEFIQKNKELLLELNFGV